MIFAMRWSVVVRPLMPLFCLTFLWGPWLCSNAWCQSELTRNTKKLDAGESPGAAKLKDVAWLTGIWRGDGLGGICEETWNPPLAGGMAGTFRLVKDEKLEFSEFFILSETDGSLSLKLRHFDARFHGWETKDKFVEFKLISVEDKTAWFDGLTYRLNEDGSMNAFVAIKQRDGTMREGVFTYKPFRASGRR